MLLSTAGFYTMRKLRQSGPRFLSLLLVYIQTWKCKGRPYWLFSKIDKPFLRLAKYGIRHFLKSFSSGLYFQPPFACQLWVILFMIFSKNVLSCFYYLNILNCSWNADKLKLAESQVFHVCSNLPKDVHKKLSLALSTQRENSQNIVLQIFWEIGAKVKKLSEIKPPL
jgi:hypothetical protein